MPRRVNQFHDRSKAIEERHSEDCKDHEVRRPNLWQGRIRSKWIGQQVIREKWLEVCRERSGKFENGEQRRDAGGQWGICSPFEV